MTRLPQVLVNVPGVDKARADEDAVLAAAVAEAEFELGDGGRVLLRPSGTEPLVRVMVEAAHRRARAQPSPTGSRTSSARSSPCPDGVDPASPASVIRLRRRRTRVPRLTVVDIREIDQADEALVHRHWEIGRDAEAAYRPYDFYPPWETAWMTYQAGREDLRFVLLGAFDGDTMVGAARDGREPARQPALGLVARSTSTPPASGRASAGRWTRRASTWPAPAGAGC